MDEKIFWNNVVAVVVGASNTLVLVNGRRKRIDDRRIGDIEKWDKAIRVQITDGSEQKWAYINVDHIAWVEQESQGLVIETSISGMQFWATHTTDSELFEQIAKAQ